MTVSATHEARQAATAASAADPPARRSSSPAVVVAGWPAATAARIDWTVKRGAPAGCKRLSSGPRDASGDPTKEAQMHAKHILFLTAAALSLAVLAGPSLGAGSANAPIRVTGT